jgi:hypothetical protein
VYAINSISYSTLSKLVRPSIVLSFNSPKPTKGLDVLTNHLALGLSGSAKISKDMVGVV